MLEFSCVGSSGLPGIAGAGPRSGAGLAVLPELAALALGALARPILAELAGLHVAPRQDLFLAVPLRT